MSGSGPGTEPGGAAIGRRLLIAVGVVLVVGGGLATTWYSQHRTTAPQTVAAGSSSPTAPPAPASAPAPAPAGITTRPTSRAPATTHSTGASQEEALAELQHLRAQSLSRLRLDGRWVAQVASKSVGITDPLQLAANGTHVFYAADILAESKQALSTVGDPSAVLVLQSTDFGKHSTAADGQPYWVTLVDANFSDSKSVNAWCARTYTSLNAEQLADTCAPRTLSPPHT